MRRAPGRYALRPGRAPWGGLALVCVLLTIAGVESGLAQEEEPNLAEDPHGEVSLIKPLATKSLLLDGASVGALTVVVGERGHVLLSRDQGLSWRQAVVPTRATLTGVFFINERQGWAVGHDAVILRTGDGGESWELVYSAPEEQRPLLDVWFKDELNGFAIGAYGFFLETSDGGATWTDRLIVESEPTDDDPYAFDSGADVHLNHVARSDSGRLYVAAEAGMVFRSDDDGGSWIELPSPYPGSFFGSLPLAGDSLLLFGLRGNLYRSDDAGETWSPIETGTVAMLTDAVRRPDGSLVIAGLAGAVLVSHDGGASFALVQQPDRQGVSSILSMNDGSLLLIGEHGVSLLGAGALGGGAS